MLILKTLSPGAAAYFLDGRHPGRWSSPAGDLLGLEGAVRRSDLVAVLAGCDPRTGAFLPTVAPRRRRAGWDLAFCAPKSLSLLAAMNGEGGESVVTAHVDATEAVVSHLSGRIAGAGLVAASFDHRSNAASEPHLHTHVLVANLTRSNGQWSALGETAWYVDRRAIGALYHLALRRELERQGWALDWRLRPDGLADLADVPRAAVRAASSQSRLSVAMGGYRARAAAVPANWSEKVAGEGLHRAPGPGGSVPVRLDDPAVARSVATRLAVRRSDFRQADALVALAATHAGGALPQEAQDWVTSFCESALEVRSPTAGRRWTTKMARAADYELSRLLGADRKIGPPLSLDRADRELVGDRAPSAWRMAERLLTSARPVEVLGTVPGTSDLLSHAEALHACREVWEEAGLRAALCSPDATGEARWAALSGLEPHRHGEKADVIVVDQADRRTTAELLRIAEQANVSGARLVLVEGGTMPRLTNPASHGLVEFADQTERISCGPHVPWQPSPGHSPARDSPARDSPARDSPDRDTPAVVGRDAARQALRAWIDAGGEEALLVGLGIEEVRALNLAAQNLLPPNGPSINNRWGNLRAGDRVVVLRAGDARRPYGTFGTLASVNAATRSAEILWEGEAKPEPCNTNVLSGVGPGQAVTTRLGAVAGRPLVVLGRAESARGLDRSRVIWSTAPVLETESRHLAVGM